MKTSTKSHTAGGGQKRRRSRRPDARPDEILTAALAEFTESGFSGARVEDIARRAGVSKGTIYLYFPSKMAMLEALVESSAGRIAEAASYVVEHGAARDPEMAYRTVLRLILNAFSDREISAAPRLVMSEAERFPELARYYRERVIESGMKAIQGLLQAGVAAGRFRPVNPDVMARVFVGPAMAHMLLTLLFNA